MGLLRRLFGQRQKSAKKNDCLPGWHPRQPPPTIVAYPLEPRIMFDGAIGAIDAEIVDITVDAAFLAADPVDFSHTDTESTPPAPVGFVPPSTDNSSENKEIVFINSSVLNAEEIVDDLPQDAEIVYLTSGEDGIAEISDYLADQTDIDTIRIISHGNEGYFVLNGQIIDSEYLDRNGEAIASWGDALSEDGDIMIYGCDLAATAEGQTLVENIADLTGADVAAATTATGGV